MRALADEDLIPLMARGDARAFEAIYERHSGAAYSLAYRMVGTRSVAEDVTQEAFLNLWRSGAHYDRARGSVRTWILGIVHHRAIDALRRASVHSKRRSDDETAAERLEAPERVEEDVARRDEAAIVRNAMDVLPARPAQGDRAGVLRRVHARRDRGDAGVAGGNREGPDAAGSEEDARDTRARGGGDMSDHDRFEDAAGAFVLGALPDDERAAFAAHLETCAVCQAEVEELSVAAHALPMSAPRDEAAACAEGADHGRGRARGRAAGVGERAAPRTEAPSAAWRCVVADGRRAALACATLLRRASAPARLLFGGGDGRTVPFEADPSLQQASAELEIDGDKAVLVANGLPAPPEGQVYMVWLVGPDGKPKPTSALFKPRGDGSATASVTGDIDDVGGRDRQHRGVAGRDGADLTRPAHGRR